MLQAYRFALDPTPGQDAVLRSHCGGQRFAFNWGLALVKANLGQRQAETSYGIPVDEVTPVVPWSAYSLRKLWNRVKDEIAPWWGENSKEAYSSGLANLATALGNWSASRKGTRAGRKMKFPRFRGKRVRLSCRFTTGAFGLAEDRRHVRLPRIGTVRTHESTRKLARHVEHGRARIRSATVTYRSGRWFCSFSVEITRTHPAPTRPGSVVGVDLGVKSLAVLSTGEIIANPRHLEVAQRELRRLQCQASRRIGPDRRTRRAPSQRWRKTQARIARLHTAVTNARRDGLHKLTTRLAQIHGTVVVEDLNVAGMLKNRRLARHIAGVGMGEFRRQLEYKTGWSGGRAVVADRWYPSSKTCSACGAVKAKLRLAERTYHCDQCGLVLDRDLNAARNLAQLVDEVSGRHVLPEFAWATVNEPDGNPTSDPHYAGSGYRHGKTHTNWCGSTSARQRTDSGHVFTRFLNGSWSCSDSILVGAGTHCEEGTFLVSQRVFGGPEVLELVEVDRPEPGPGEVLVRVHAAGVNPADWKLRSGFLSMFGEPPFTLGLEVSGVVEEVGAQVGSFQSGDEVFGLLLSRAGAHAEYVVLAAEALATIPPSLDHVRSAALPVAALTAWQALVGVGELHAGQRVLIHAAAGGVGHLAVQIAKARGAHVIGTARAEKHAFLRDLGADELIDYTAVDFTTVVRDVDVVFDLVGNGYAARSLDTLKPGGLLIDAVGGEQELTVPEVAARGLRFARFYVSPSGKDLEQITELVEGGALRVLIDQVLPLEQAAKAHELSETNRVSGKIVLAISTRD